MTISYKNMDAPSRYSFYKTSRQISQEKICSAGVKKFIYLPVSLILRMAVFIASAT